MKEILKHKELLSKKINEYLDSRLSDLGKINFLGADVIEKLRHFIIGGKLVRGCLIIESTAMFSNNNEELVEESIKAAIAIEIFQSAVLMHDDIFDRDNTRRGKPAIHYQYELEAKEKGFTDPKHYGASMATCTGDIGFFMCNELLSSMNIDSLSKDELLKLFSREVSYVAAAEMHDIYLENLKKNYSFEDILGIYKYKTARYTFSIPLVIGAIIAKENKDTINKLMLLGDYLGVIFQIKDDELGIFSDVSDIGKSVGIDIRDNKKTIYHYYLYDTSDESRLKLLDSIFGNQNLTLEDIDLIRKLIRSSGVQTKITKIIDEYIHNCQKIISELNISSHFKHTLQTILKFNLERNK